MKLDEEMIKDRLLISGHDGNHPYLVETFGLDPKVLEDFARTANELIAQRAQMEHATSQAAQQPSPQQTQENFQPDLNLNFAPPMSLEDRLQAWREMEQMMGRPQVPGAEQAIREQYEREKGNSK